MYYRAIKYVEFDQNRVTKKLIVIEKFVVVPAEDVVITIARLRNQGYRNFAVSDKHFKFELA